MSRRLLQVVVLCEDAQQETFVLRFLKTEGWLRHQIRVEKCPKGKMAGEQWVRERYPLEVKTLRSQPYLAKSLLVVRDGDMAGLRARLQELDATLAVNNLDRRGMVERIAVIAPCRNIETWLAYLSGVTVDELTEYPKLARVRECIPMVNELKRMCDQNALRRPAPESLEHACTEYRTKVR